MSDVESAVTQPGEEPPPGVSSEILWRLAVRLWRDHQPDRIDGSACGGCRRPWPCSGMRMAELGLSAARA